MCKVPENLTDVYGVTDTFVTDLVRIESLGPNARLTFATRQLAHHGVSEHVVTAKLIASSETLATWATDIAKWWPNSKGELATVTDSTTALQ